MKAAVVKRWGEAGGLSIETVPDPVCSPTQAVVRLKISGLNHLDLWVRRGMPFLKLTLPHILGSDGAGVVESVGESVRHIKVGDEVIVHPSESCGRCPYCLSRTESLCRGFRVLGEHIAGTNAQCVAVDGASLFLKPAEMAWDVAGTMALVSTTAWQMLDLAELNPGDTVLIHAAGSGVSLVAMQLARLRGARVFVTAGSRSKLDFAKTLGAEQGWVYDAPEMRSDLKHLTRSRGVDAVLDHVGASVWDENLANLKWGGRMITCGASSGFEVKLDLRQIFYRQLRIIGSTMGSKADFPRLIELVTRGKIQIPVFRTFPLGSIQAAHACLEAREVVGKVAISL